MPRVYQFEGFQCVLRAMSQTRSRLVYPRQDKSHAVRVWRDSYISHVQDPKTFQQDVFAMWQKVLQFIPLVAISA